MRIILVGFMGVGKTTIGKCLSRQLSCDFVDMDHEIESAFNMSINRFFEEKGEAVFRSVEQKMFRTFLKQSNVVISTGGGSLCSDELMQLANKNGLTIHIRKPKKELIRVLNKNKTSRPLLKDKSQKQISEFVSNLYAKRRSFYNQAHHYFYNNSAPESIVKRILKKID